MYLTLQIVNAPNLEQLPQRSCTFGVEGGKIGRLPGNEWCIPFDYLHGLHATVRFYNGLFFIEKRGQHRVAVNSPDRDLKTDETYPIRDGDRLYLDEIEVSVRVGTERPAAAVQNAAPAPAGRAQTPMFSERTGPPRKGGLLDIDPKDDCDIDNFLKFGSNTPLAVTRHEAADHQSILNDSVYLPSATAPPREQLQNFQSQPALDDEWYKTQYQTTPPPPSPAPSLNRAPASNQPGSINAQYRGSPVAADAEPKYPDSRVPATSSQGSGGDLAPLLQSLGLNSRDLIAGEAELLGRALRTAVAGVVIALQVRAEMRSRFRLATTNGWRAEETLLESSPNVDDVLHRFFRQRAPGAPAFDAALGSALQDIKCHEYALLDAQRIAFDRLLEHFNPEAIQDQLDGTTMRGPRSMLGGKGRQWEAYLEFFAEISADREGSFKKMYAPYFADAYQEALERYQTTARSKRRP